MPDAVFWVPASLAPQQALQIGPSNMFGPSTTGTLEVLKCWRHLGVGNLVPNAFFWGKYAELTFDVF